MEIPGTDEIRALHERHAPGAAAFEAVWTHCVIVSEIAERLVAEAGLAVDADLVRAGCLLHDLGVYRLYGPSGKLDHTGYVRHGVLGHAILRDEGFPEEICRFCSCHTGVGLTRDDIARQGLPVPPGDYVAVTAEERLVMYADKFHTKADPPTFVSAGTYARRVRRYGEDKVPVFEAMRESFGEPDLRPLMEKYGHGII